MKKKTVLFRVKTEYKPWEEVPEDNIFFDVDDTDEEIDNYFIFYLINHFNRGAKIRWNYEGDFLGHYVTWKLD